MRVLNIDHPLVAHKLTVLRDKNTPSSVFRQLADELVTLLAYEATRNVAVAPAEVETPVATTIGSKLTDPKPMVVPILRAGLGTTYANRLPDDLTGRQCFVVDPMLATGHTLIASVNYLLEKGARDITCVTLLSAPEGIETMERELDKSANITVVTAAIDEKLNEKNYIVPGLGDAGDRLFGVVD